MRKALLTASLLLILLASAFAIRMNYAAVWDEHPQRATFNDGTPLLLNLDGYFYLRVAKQIQQGTYDTFDEKSVYPQGAKRRSIPPLLSTITAWVSTTFSMSLEQAALLIPAIIGSLVVLPVFFLGRAYGGTLMGFCAALFTGLAPGLVQRSSLGFFDTDGGNVFFAASCAFLFMQFGSTKNWKRYLWFAGGMLAFGVFLLWWDQTKEAVVAIALLPFLVALVLDYRPARREAGIFLTILAIATLGIIALLGQGFIESMLHKIQGTFSYIRKAPSIFPNPAMFVGEQTQLSFSDLSAFIAASIPGFILGLFGVLLFAWKSGLRFLYLSGFVLVGCFTFIAFRFTIFFIPLFALGAAFLARWLWSLDTTKRTTWRMVASGWIVLIIGLQLMYNDSLADKAVPATHPELTEAMVKLNEYTPEDAVVWANWSQAYPLMLYSERATIVDGQSRTAMRFWVNNAPLASTSQQMAANWMQFYIVRGQDGLERAKNIFGGVWKDALPRLLHVFDVGPTEARSYLQKGMPNSDENISEILTFLFPSNTPPIFVYLDHKTMHGPWYTIGAWDFTNNSGQLPIVKLFLSAIEQEKTLQAVVFSEGKIMAVDRQKGMAKVGDVQYQLSDYVTYTQPGYDQQNYRDKGLILGFDPSVRGGALVSQGIPDTVFYKLLVKRQNDPMYFRKVFGTSLLVQCWQVHGDQYASIQ